MVQVMVLHSGGSVEIKKINQVEKRDMGVGRGAFESSGVLGYALLAPGLPGSNEGTE